FTGFVPQPGDVLLNQTDENTDFSGRFSLGLGLEYSFGQLKVGLEGTIEYWSYVPTVSNPVSAAGSELGVAPPSPAVARIGDDDMTSGRVMLVARLPIF
ncbi:MAG: hypothetical protein ACREXT_03395, partial [Gammaproteobacteria bacterium]